MVFILVFAPEFADYFKGPVDDAADVKNIAITAADEGEGGLFAAVAAPAIDEDVSVLVGEADGGFDGEIVEGEEGGAGEVGLLEFGFGADVEEDEIGPIFGEFGHFGLGVGGFEVLVDGRSGWFGFFLVILGGEEGGTGSEEENDGEDDPFSHT